MFSMLCCQWCAHPNLCCALQLTLHLQGWFDDAQLSSLLQDEADAFEAGAPFPDWGYR